SGLPVSSWTTFWSHIFSIIVLGLAILRTSNICDVFIYNFLLWLSFLPLSVLFHSQWINLLYGNRLQVRFRLHAQLHSLLLQAQKRNAASWQQKESCPEDWQYLFRQYQAQNRVPVHTGQFFLINSQKAAYQLTLLKLILHHLKYLQTYFPSRLHQNWSGG